MHRPRALLRASQLILASKTASLNPFGSLFAISDPFHSHLKVLFIFRSRYLFAIGLPTVFSFRWALPPALPWSPNQDDSSANRSDLAACVDANDGALTLFGAAFQRTCTSTARNPQTRLQTTIQRARERTQISNLSYSIFTRRY